jgi:hypothetical protein
LWGTYKQWAALGAQVRKGERGSPVVYWGRFDAHKNSENPGEAVSRVLCKQFRIGAVFFQMLFSLLPQALGVVGKWESWFLDFHFPTTHNLILRFFPV